MITIEEKLVSMGLSKMYAKRYIDAYGTSYVKEIINYVLTHGDKSRNPSALLAKLLRDRVTLRRSNKTTPRAHKEPLSRDMVYERKVDMWKQMTDKQKIGLFSGLMRGNSVAEEVFSKWANDNNLSTQKILLDSFIGAPGFRWILDFMVLGEFIDEECG